jgi:four helix bundle protein
MDEADLKARTKQFALRCMRLADTLPNTHSGRTIASQLVRSSTSVGANYRAACRGRSKAEFVSKLGVVEEEVDESAYWIELIVERGLKPVRLMQGLHSEADQLTRIVASSIRTARAGSNKSAIRNPKSAVL